MRGVGENEEVGEEEGRGSNLLKFLKGEGEEKLEYG
jgi:hypothetical protein